MACFVSKVTSRGQITLPQSIRDAEGITSDDYVTIQPVGALIVLRKAELQTEDVMAIFRAEARKKGIKKSDLLNELSAVRKARRKPNSGPPHAIFR